MTLKLNGVEIDDLRVNGVKADKGYLNGAKVYERIKAGDVIDGDIVVGTLEGRWVLVAPAANRALEKWGHTATPVSGVGQTTSTSFDSKTSTENTNRLNRYPHDAAMYCRSLGPEYQLPNIQTLRFLYENRQLIDSTDTTSDSTYGNISLSLSPGGSKISRSAYSSTQVYNTAKVHCVDFSVSSDAPTVHSFSKDRSRLVIPVRFLGE